MITEFRGPYRFLSNFYPAIVHLPDDPLEYPTVEHAYQAAKSSNPVVRRMIQTAATPGAAKRLGHNTHVTLGWNYKRLGVMFTLLEEKFSYKHLREWLIKTYPEMLEEGNTWGDMFWGTCSGVGQNYLGQMLMEIRQSVM